MRREISESEGRIQDFAKRKRDHQRLDAGKMGPNEAPHIDFFNPTEQMVRPRPPACLRPLPRFFWTRGGECGCVRCAKGTNWFLETLPGWTEAFPLEMIKFHTYVCYLQQSKTISYLA